MLSFLSELKTANRLASQKFHVIFFAEGGHYFQYFRHLFEELVLRPGIRIAYITGDKNDAVLQDHRVEGFCLKATLAGVFPRLQADVMVMTMPDLQNFIFKKSPSVKKYVYVFHALVSTHQQYRTHAFDHYDAIFCTGPQQEAEVRESEKLYGLAMKEIVRYGYPLLEELKAKANQATVQKRKVLVAPSCYKEGIFNTCIEELVERLGGMGYQLWLRPHPEFIKRNKKVYDRLVKRMDNANNVRFDASPSVFTHLVDAGILVTDRSGIALEYAFATKRPVLFVDTPLKVQNPEAYRYKAQPLENTHRPNIGEAVLPNGLQRLEETLQRMNGNADGFWESIIKAEAETVFPSDHWANGLDYIKTHITQ